MSDDLELSVVIPAFDEGKRLHRTLESAVDYLARRHPRFELIVVDDGSRDDTVDIAERHAAHDPRVKLLRLGENQGKGAAVRRGVLAARGEWVLYMDADLSTPMAELEKLLAAGRAGKNVVFGSRGLVDSRVRRSQGRIRETMGRTFNAIVQRAVLSGISDTQCGFKLLSREAASAIFSRTTVDRFAFDVEVLLIALDLGYGVDEVGVDWFHDPESRVSPVTDAARMLYDVVRLRIRRKRRSTGR